MSELQDLALASHCPHPSQLLSPANVMKHAQTEGQFQAIVSPTLHVQLVENIGSQPARFDSHNILRSDETPDLLHMPEEEGEIWLKRSEKSDKMTGKETSPCAGSVSSVDVDGPKILSTASISAFILNTPLDDSLHNAQPLDSISGVTGQSQSRQQDDLVNEDGASLRSKSIQTTEASINTSTRKASQKSLTRRLSSFFSRSFRRKSGAGTSDGQGKRVSYTGSTVQPTVHRPASGSGSADIDRSLQESSSDYAFSRSQHLLGLGFSMDIEEALKNQPDSFIFVPLSESGYFSAKFEDFEKLPEMSLMEESSDWSGQVVDERTPSSACPPDWIGVKSVNASQTEAPYVPSSGTTAHWLGRAKSADENGGPAGVAMSQPQRRYQKDKLSQDDARRLSFMEGTSIMESINHLAYPSRQQDYHHSSFSHDNLSNANSAGRIRQAKKLKFKKHPWRWIKSKF